MRDHLVKLVVCRGMLKEGPDRCLKVFRRWAIDVEKRGFEARQWKPLRHYN